MMKWFRRWEYGQHKGVPCRRNWWTGEVQFVLWKAGQQGHTEDFWYPMHSSHWPEFTPTDAEAQQR